MSSTKGVHPHSYTYYSLLPVPHYYLAESISEEAEKTEHTEHTLCMHVTKKEKKHGCLWLHLCTSACTPESGATKHMKNNCYPRSITCKLTEIGFGFHCVLWRNLNLAFQLHSIVQEILTFPGSSLERGTLRKHLFKDRLCRIEFYRDRKVERNRTRRGEWKGKAEEGRKQRNILNSSY